ncbi:M56 family metallopeptidase [Aquiflexum sp.]|uniref:M56 family metallopeptidase n=1 Tax=Aquiflexum sp. TaxID=1872584 RepID=UPI0035933D95
MNPFWIYILEASTGIALVWTLYYIFLRKLTFFGWNRFFLLAGMFFSLILPILNIPLNLNNGIPVQDFMLSLNTFQTLSDGTNVISSMSLFNISQGILYLYFAVAGSKLIVFGIGTVSLFYKVKGSERLKFQNNDIYFHPDFKPSSFLNMILMPTTNKKIPGNLQILLHESEHVRLGHFWDLLFIYFTKSLLWINPFVYLLENALREVHEFQADRKVIQQTTFKDYCQILLDNINHGHDNHLINSFNQFQIKNRIVMMNKSRSTNVKKWRYLIGMPLLVLMIGLFSSKIAGQNEKVIGNWTGSDFEFTLNEGPDLKDVIEGGKNLHMNGKFILNKNKTYQIMDPNGTINGKGTWNINSRNLILTDQDGSTTEYLIEEVTDKKLITVHKVSTETPLGKVVGVIRLTYSKD